MINQRIFHEALKFVSIASGKKDVRYYLNGVLFEVRPNRLTLAATNGHELAVAEIVGEFGNVNTDVVVTNDDVKALLGLFKSEGYAGFQVAPAMEGGLLFTDTNNRSLRCAAVEAKFPDWRRVAPSGKPESMGRFGIVGDAIATAAKACGKLDKSSPGAVVCEVYQPGAGGGMKLQPLSISSRLEGLETAWIYSCFAKL